MVIEQNDEAGTSTTKKACTGTNLNCLFLDHVPFLAPNENIDNPLGISPIFSVCNTCAKAISFPAMGPAIYQPLQLYFINS